MKNEKKSYFINSRSKRVMCRISILSDVLDVHELIVNKDSSFTNKRTRNTMLEKIPKN